MKLLVVISIVTTLLSLCNSSPTTPHLKEILLGRCFDFTTSLPRPLQADVNCSQIYSSFKQCFAYKDPNNVKPEDFDPLYSSLVPSLYQPPYNRSLFWSDENAEADQVTKEFPNFFFNIQDTFIGKITSALNFCGCTTPSESCIDGIQYGQDCPESITNGTVRGCYNSFWSSLSARFAASTKAYVNVLMVPPINSTTVYSRNSIFSLHVIPNLNPNFVTNICLLMIKNRLMTDSCKAGTVLNLYHDFKEQFEGKTIPITCEDDYEKVHEYLCQQDPSAKECIFVKQYEAELGKVALGALASLAGGYAFGVLSTVIITFIIYMACSLRLKRRKGGNLYDTMPDE